MVDADHLKFLKSHHTDSITACAGLRALGIRKVMMLKKDFIVSAYFFASKLSDFSQKAPTMMAVCSSS
jgi:hypothetical protein